MDLAFILDGSGSVGQKNFNLMKEFVKNIISNLKLGPNGVRIAMIQYATEVRTEFLYLDDMSDILFEIDAIDYMNGSTFTAKAILHYSEFYKLISRRGEKDQKWHQIWIFSGWSMAHCCMGCRTPDVTHATFWSLFVGHSIF